MLASWSALLHPAIFFLVGIRLWAIGRRNGYATQCEFFRERFESPAFAYALFVVLVALLVPYLLIGLLGAGSVVESLTQGMFPGTFARGAVPPSLTALVVSLVVLSYVFVGGVRSTAWANTFQTVVFLGVGVATLATIGSKLGGAEAAYRLVAQHALIPPQPGAGEPGDLCRLRLHPDLDGDVPSHLSALADGAQRSCVPCLAGRLADLHGAAVGAHGSSGHLGRGPVGGGQAPGRFPESRAGSARGDARGLSASDRRPRRRHPRRDHVVPGLSVHEPQHDVHQRHRGAPASRMEGQRGSNAVDGAWLRRGDRRRDLSRFPVREPSNLPAGYLVLHWFSPGWFRSSSPRSTGVVPRGWVRRLRWRPPRSLRSASSRSSVRRGRPSRRSGCCRSSTSSSPPPWLSSARRWSARPRERRRSHGSSPPVDGGRSRYT